MTTSSKPGKRMRTHVGCQRSMNVKRKSLQLGSKRTVVVSTLFKYNGVSKRQNLVDFKQTGLTHIKEDVAMQSIGRAVFNTIGNYLTFKLNGNKTDLQLNWKNTESWKQTINVVHESGYVDLHFHPYMLRYLTLSPRNHLTTGQLLGTYKLHSMLEGCIVRPQGMRAAHTLQEQGPKCSIGTTARSIFICSVQEHTKNNGGPQFLVNFAVYEQVLHELFVIDIQLSVAFLETVSFYTFNIFFHCL
jgi:hypothetical protein